MSSPALAGLRVVDLSWVVAGPLVGRALADYGATVVRVESSTKLDTARLVGPFHDGVQQPDHSGCYGNCNAGKLGLSLDLSVSCARDVVRDLAAWGDVLIESFTPGVMARWGLDYPHLRELNSELVMLSTSLMGQTGPYATFAGFGNVGAAMSGFQHLVGWPDRPPFGPFGPYTDYVAPRFALVLLLAALDARRRGAGGCYIDLSQAECGIQFLAPQIADYVRNGRIAEREGNGDESFAPHGVYGCAEEDGRPVWIAIAVRHDMDWQALAEVCGGPELAADPRYSTLEGRREHRAELDAVLTDWTASRHADELEAQLQALGVPAHRATSSASALTDPQMRHQHHFVELEHPRFGQTTVEASRHRLSRTPGQVSRRAPDFGSDNRCVLHDLLGYDDEHVAQLKDEGALR